MPDKKKGNPIAGLIGLAVAVVILIIAFSSCGSNESTAPDQDTRYTMALDHDHVPHGVFSNVLQLGRDVCKDLDKPMPIDQVVGEVEGLSKDNTTTVQNPDPVPMFTTQQSQAIVYDAVQAYCPNHASELPAH